MDGKRDIRISQLDSMLSVVVYSSLICRVLTIVRVSFVVRCVSAIVVYDANCDNLSYSYYSRSCLLVLE